jgi:hypothetical protein
MDNLADTPFSNYQEILRRNPAKVADVWAVRMAGGKQESCILLDWKMIESAYFAPKEKDEKTAGLPF